jgi:hypothetical protein
MNIFKSVTTRVAWLIVVVATVALAWGIRAHRRRHSFPPPVELQQVLAMHVEETRRDSARVADAVAVADVALRRQRELSGRASAQRALTATLRAQADDVRAEVGAARNAPDSLLAWTQAYESRLAEVGSLATMVALRDSVAMWATLRGDSLGAALAASERHAQRADSVLGLVVEHGRCRILRMVPCPTRRVIVAGAVVAVLLGRVR